MAFSINILIVWRVMACARGLNGPGMDSGPELWGNLGVPRQFQAHADHAGRHAVW